MGKKLYLITNYESCPMTARLDSVQQYICDQFELDDDINPHLFSCLEKIQELKMHLELYHKSVGFDPISDQRSNIDGKKIT